jgi:hypothetical protein
MARSVRAERYGDVFLDGVRDLLAGGRCYLAAHAQAEKEPGRVELGWIADDKVYLNGLALDEVKKIRQLPVTDRAVWEQLWTDGVLADRDATQWKVNRRRLGTQERVIAVKAEALGLAPAPRDVRLVRVGEVARVA